MSVDVVAAMSAIEAGDLDALSAAVGAENMPNGSGLPLALGDSLLILAIYRGPATLVDALLDAGADPDPSVNDGFPVLIAALSTERPDRYAILERLLRAGADTERVGLNGWTALHWAVGHDDVEAVKLLLRYGADRERREEIDDRLTPAEIAVLRATRGSTVAEPMLALLQS